MKVSTATLAAVAAVSAQYVNTSTVGYTVLTTYCPDSTTFTYGGSTYTVTKPTTLTITDCSCEETAGPTGKGSVASSAGSPSGEPSGSATVKPSGSAPVEPGPKNNTTTVEYTVLTTYCPDSTTFTYGGSTYTVTKPTTLTITDCSCEETAGPTGKGSVASSAGSPSGKASGSAPVESGPKKNSTSAISPKPTPTTTTEIVTELTTVCPGPTTLTYNSKTYVVTKSTTLTITDCPCTLTHTISPSTEHPEKTSSPTGPSKTIAPVESPASSQSGKTSTTPAKATTGGTTLPPIANGVAANAVGAGAAMAALAALIA